MLIRKMQNPMTERSGLLCLLNSAGRLSKDCRERSAMSRMRDNLFGRRGSIGANYIEANEAIGKKDFVMKIKICRREAKESRYWLRLLDVDGQLAEERQQLSSEATELMNIFGAILRKCE
jgi:four helix bundle protein